MNTLCKDCSIDSMSHSFNLLDLYKNANNEDVYLFYTRISDAKKYNDTDSILNHYNNLLNFVNPTKWIWVVDFAHFELKHYLHLKTPIELAKLLDKFGKIDNVIVINQNKFVNLLINLLTKFINMKYNIFIFDKNQKNNLKTFLIKENINTTYIDFIVNCVG
jgi:hypothetical protein